MATRSLLSRLDYTYTVSWIPSLVKHFPYVFYLIRRVKPLVTGFWMRSVTLEVWPGTIPNLACVVLPLIHIMYVYNIYQKYLCFFQNYIDLHTTWWKLWYQYRPTYQLALLQDNSIKCSLPLSKSVYLLSFQDSPTKSWWTWAQSGLMCEML